MRRILSLFISLLFILKADGQEYNYVHYDTKDGLAGSTVYRMCQDKKGYIWFATDNGVSRFDGKRFKNFTTEDGLTDNEILYLHNDSKGRIWMTPFSKGVCYYFDGKIHNSQTDTNLRSLNNDLYYFSFENNKGVYFDNKNGIFLYPDPGSIKIVLDYKKLAEEYGLQPTKFFSWWSAEYPNSILRINMNKVFYEKDDKIVLLKTMSYEADKDKTYGWIDETLELVPYKFPPPYFFTTIEPVNDSLRIHNTLKGSWLVNKNGITGQIFLPGKRISNSLVDNEGNFWFATLGEGVYRLTSRSMKTFSDNQEFFCVEKANGKIYAGAGNGDRYIIKDQVLKEKKRFIRYFATNDFTRLYKIKTDSFGTVYFGYDPYLAKIQNGKEIVSEIRPIKSIDVINKDFITVCTNNYTLKIKTSDLSVVDTIWRERGTKVVYEKGIYYIGTLNGLVIVDEKGQATRVGEQLPLLSKRIVDICRNMDGSLWIASNDNGVLLFKNGKVDTVINVHNGLTSSICRSLFLHGRHLWVGTNKGVNKVDVITKKVLATFSTSDGLTSDIINDIYVDDSLIWVCTPAGLIYFNETDILNTSACNLDLEHIRVSGNEIHSPNIELSYKNNNISFDYSAISFKSAGEVTYYYKLKGLDDTLKTTRLTTLSYPSLPPGNYEFQLYAVNKFGKKSNEFKISFSIAAPFWKTIWFWLSISILTIIGFWYLLRRRYRKLQHRLEEKNAVTKRMAELEQTALRAQMNPHFIFNCLSSIQHFILKGDFEPANRYITQLATLIRQTLDNSSKSSISVADELKFLVNYLELEQMRFVSKFQYEIFLDKKIEPDHTYMPPMMLQPFVENAIRHGIRYKEGEGLINIRIEKGEGFLEFMVEDNGVGRKISERYKTKQHIEYQSKGISLTRERMEILAANDAEKIKTTIIDLQDDDGNAAGTRVKISFPLGIIDKLN